MKIVGESLVLAGIEYETTLSFLPARNGGSVFSVTSKSSSPGNNAELIKQYNESCVYGFIEPTGR